VAEDWDTRLLLADILDLDGYTVRLAPSGAAALALLAGWRPDVILLDLLALEDAGGAFAHAYRQRPPPHAPIIVLTTSPVSAQRLAAIAPVATLRKPFAVADLLALVGQYVRRP
jgi:CheY-like chemotaxis protein